MADWQIAIDSEAMQRVEAAIAALLAAATEFRLAVQSLTDSASAAEKEGA